MIWFCFLLRQQLSPATKVPKTPKVPWAYLYGQVSLSCLSKSPLVRDKLVSLYQQYISCSDIQRSRHGKYVFLTNRYTILLNQWHYLFRTCCCRIEICSVSNSVRRQAQENLGLLFLIWNLERIYFTFCQGSIKQHII